MTGPPDLSDLRLPVMAAPMTMASSQDLIIASCRAGVVGGFQAANAGTPEGLAAWYAVIAAAETESRARKERFAPFVVNLLATAGQDPVVHQARLAESEVGDLSGWG